MGVAKLQDGWNKPRLECDVKCGADGLKRGKAGCLANKERTMSGVFRDEITQRGGRAAGSGGDLQHADPKCCN